MPATLAAWRLGGEIALGRAEFLEFARDWTGEAFKALPENPVIAAQRAEALMLDGDTAAAAGLWEKIWSSEPEPGTLAALILCEAIEAQTTHAPDEGADEEATSRAFVDWYQKLIARRAQPVIGKINGQLDKLSRALPTAARMLETALAEAEVRRKSDGEPGAGEVRLMEGSLRACFLDRAAGQLNSWTRNRGRVFQPRQSDPGSCPWSRRRARPRRWCRRGWRPVRTI